MIIQSWESVLHHIWSAESDIPTALLMAPGKLQDKYCRMIKVITSLMVKIERIGSMQYFDIRTTFGFSVCLIFLFQSI